MGKKNENEWKKGPKKIYESWRPYLDAGGVDGALPCPALVNPLPIKKIGRKLPKKRPISRRGTNYSASRINKETLWRLPVFEFRVDQIGSDRIEIVDFFFKEKTTLFRKEVLPGSNDFYCFFSGSYWVLLGFTGFYWVLLGFTGFYWVLLGFTGLYRAIRGFTKLNWYSKGFPVDDRISWKYCKGSRTGKTSTRVGIPQHPTSASRIPGFFGIDQAARRCRHLAEYLETTQPTRRWTWLVLFYRVSPKETRELETLRTCFVEKMERQLCFFGIDFGFGCCARAGVGWVVVLFWVFWVVGERSFFIGRHCIGIRPCSLDVARNADRDVPLLACLSFRHFSLAPFGIGTAVAPLLGFYRVLPTSWSSFHWIRWGLALSCLSWSIFCVKIFETGFYLVLPSFT